MKETIIYLHGIVGNQQAFKHQIEELGNEYNCIGYDYVGYSEGELGKNIPCTLDILVAQLHGIFQTQKIEKAHLCALSYGCLIATAYAYRYPDHVQSLTFVGGYCNQDSEYIDNLHQLLREKSQYTHFEWLRRYAFATNPNHPEISENTEGIFCACAEPLHPTILENAVRLQTEFPSMEYLSAIKQPILWVMGDLDGIHLGTLYNLHEMVPQVQYHEIRGAGHVAHIHKRQEFMDLFKPFLVTNQLKVGQ
ncbi:alpha/beta hydrolase [Priestia megaterium]|nr:alpha/beta hydrolase [Priestia megaterium]